MYTSIISTAAAFGLLLTPITAMPFELETRTNWHCTYPVTYTITNQSAVYAAPDLISGVFVNGPGSIASGYSYSKGQSFTGGISATWQFTKLFSAGVTASYGVTTTKGTSLTASVTCPDNVTCGITASALMLRVDGMQTINLCGSGLSADKTFPCTNAAPDWCPTTTFNATVGTAVPFTAYLPLAADSSTVDGQDLKAVAYSACTVGAASAGLDACPGSGLSA